MIRPAEIRALYSRLQAVKGSTAELGVAESIKAEMGRLWEKDRVPDDALSSSIERQGGASFSVLIKWRSIPVARIFNDAFVLLDSRFSLDVVNRAFVVYRYSADDFPELKKQEGPPGA